ncbi:hypothetical protein L6452_36217 [Arctium lappa]|uniref:Uncharacterized protein n=1 Tax=Arctium lappa TaxID=4217 RepID=A0ACB8Y939_ARCLA|nr:hypothetical protein L6452_36217 [Arctium lappa]
MVKASFLEAKELGLKSRFSLNLARYVSQSVLDGQLGIAGLNSSTHVLRPETLQVGTRRVKSGGATEEVGTRTSAA